MTFENTAGSEKEQAVALRSSSDMSVFYRCRFLGYQDTLYVEDDRQFYRECEIYGTTDFIFGNASAIFQHCNIYIRRPASKKTKNKKQNALIITAQGRNELHQRTAIIIQNSVIDLASDFGDHVKNNNIYFGRPWKMFSRTVVMHTEIKCPIHPAGWLEWKVEPQNKDNASSAKYQNSGVGSKTLGRVRWPGYRALTDMSDARKYNLGRFFEQDYK